MTTFLATADFARWGTSHIGALVLLMFAVAGLVSTRRCSAQGRTLVCRGLALFLLMVTAAEYTYRALEPVPDPAGEYLPLHYCGVMVFVSAYALWFRRPWACAMVYYSVLTACTQALVTPALTHDFPHPRFCFFFASHSALLLAALALPLLQGWRTRKWDPLLTLGLMDVYMLCVIPVNLLLGTNYGFTQEAPPGSILSLLGPAPWYFLVLHLPGLAVFGVLFFFVRTSASRKEHLP